MKQWYIWKYIANLLSVQPLVDDNNEDDNTDIVESYHNDQTDISVTTLLTAILEKYHMLPALIETVNH